MLSKITKLYAESHEEILKEFIVRRAPPKLYPFFGNPIPLSKFCKATDFAWPSSAIANQLGNLTSIESIWIRQEDDETILGIQVILTDGTAS